MTSQSEASILFRNFRLGINLSSTCSYIIMLNDKHRTTSANYLHSSPDYRCYGSGCLKWGCHKQPSSNSSIDFQTDFLLFRPHRDDGRARLRSDAYKMTEIYYPRLSRQEVRTTRGTHDIAESTGEGFPPLDRLSFSHRTLRHFGAEASRWNGHYRLRTARLASKRPATLWSASSGGPAASGAGRAPATNGSRTTRGAVAERSRPVSCHYAHLAPLTALLAGVSTALTEESQNVG